MALRPGPRRRAAAHRNHRGRVGREHLAERRGAAWKDKIDNQPTLKQKLWAAVDYLKAVCAGRDDRTEFAINDVTALAEKLDQDRWVGSEVTK